MNIYVGNLSYKVKEKELREIFEEYGEVTSVKVITDKATGRSKGFGFVEMADNAEGATAIKELNETEMDSRRLKVNEAREREENPRGDYRRDSR